MKAVIVALIIASLLISSCASTIPAQPPAVIEPVIQCPDSCDDNDNCTQDFCSEETNFTCASAEIQGCLKPQLKDYPVAILSSTGYVSKTGRFFAVGEVQNIAEYNIEGVTVNVDFFDSEDRLIGSKLAKLDMPILLPGQKLPFESDFLEQDISSFKLKVSDSRKSDWTQYLGFEILNHRNRYEPGVYYSVLGDIRNKLNEQRNFVDIVATFYDENGIVVGMKYAYMNIEDFRPGQSFEFELRFTEPGVIGKIANYTVQARSRR